MYQFKLKQTTGGLKRCQWN